MIPPPEACTDSIVQIYPRHVIHGIIMLYVVPNVINSSEPEPEPYKQGEEEKFMLANTYQILTNISFCNALDTIFIY